MTFGINKYGVFNKKSLSDIHESTIERIRSEVSEAAELTADTPEGQILGIINDELSQVWDALEGVHYAAYRHQAFGNALDNANDGVGVGRKGASYTIAPVRFYGAIGTAIDVDKTVSKSSNEADKFKTVQQGVISEGPKEVQEISFSGVLDSGEFILSYEGENSISLSFDDDAATIEAALKNITTLANELFSVEASLDGFKVSFEESKRVSALQVASSTLLDAADSEIEVSILRLVRGDADHAEVKCQAVNIGEVNAFAGTINILEDSIEGVEYVENVVDATVGSEVETDAAYTRRTDESLAIGASSTLNAITSRVNSITGVQDVLGFENDSTETDELGVPPGHVFIVVDGGDDLEIAQNMWEVKGGGTGFYGSQTVEMQDSDGNTQFIKFSRPTLSTIYASINIVKGDKYPENGDDLVKEAILEYGRSLGIGQKIIVYPGLISSIASIPGIDDIDIYISKNPNPNSSNNLEMLAFEVGSWIDGNIEVTSA